MDLEQHGSLPGARAVGVGVDVAGRFGGGVDEQPPLQAGGRGRDVRSAAASPPAWSMIITARAAGSSRPLVPNTLVRLGAVGVPIDRLAVGAEPADVGQLAAAWPPCR